MADLSAVVGHSRGRSRIMAPQVALIVNFDPEVVRIAPAAPLRQFTPLRPATMTETVRASANYATVIRGNTGQVAFVAQSDHATITGYTARIRQSGSSTVVATQSLGTPTPDPNNVIVSDLTGTFSGLAAGNYTVSILATSAGGSTDSAESSAFSLPLS